MQFLNEHTMTIIIGFAAVGGLVTLLLIAGLVFLGRALGKQSQAQEVATHQAAGMTVEEASALERDTRRRRWKKTALAVILILLLPILGIGYWYIKISKYRGPITDDERAMLLTAEDLEPFGLPQQEERGTYQKEFASNGLPALRYTRDVADSWAGDIDSRVTLIANLRGHSTSYRRPADSIGEAHHLLTLGDEQLCWAVRAPDGVEGNSCYLRFNLTIVRFTFYGVRFREPGSLDPVIEPTRHLLESY